MPLQKERFLMLCEACEILSSEFEGDPFCILEEGRFSVMREDGSGILPLLVRRFPVAFGFDFALGGCEELFFLKRAQLFLLMYHQRAVQSGGVLPPLEDVFHIGPIVDYQLPRGYRADGILRYSCSLANQVDNANLISEGSEYETNIRIATHYACWQELQLFNYLRGRANLPPIHMGHLDYWRWKRGREAAGNPHLCFTTNY